MLRKMRISVSILLILLMLFGVFSISFSVAATDWDSLVGTTIASIKSGSSYTKWYNASGNVSANAGYTGQCTWYALGRFYEITGINLGRAPHAKYWLRDNAGNSKVKILNGADKITAPAIAVNTGGEYGHVMIVEYVTYDSNGKPQNVYFTECNWDNNGTYNAGTDCILKKMTYSNFISNRGPDGYIVSATHVDSDIESKDYIATDFNPTIKDGIYTLKIAHTSGTMLNVYNGIKDWANNPTLTTWEKDDTGEQKFYFKHEANGKYRIYAVCSGVNGSVYNKVVDVNIGPSTSDVLNIGDSFDIWDKTSSFDYCQLFYIVHVGNGKYVIELASTPNAVLAAKTAETAATNGGAITLREYKEYTTQQWYFYNESGTAPVDPSINNALTYTVNYNTNGGSNPPSTQSKLYGTTLTLSSTIPTKVGYSFVGWSTSNDTTVEYQAGATYTANADVTLYAVWKVDEYTVSYNANGGSNAPSSQTKVYEETLILSDIVPTKTGYTFMGWATSSNSTNVIYQAGDSYSNNSDLTLYAVWKENVGLDDSDDDIDNETSDNKETIENKETVIDTNDNSNVNNDIENNDDDKDNETEQKKSGCNSSIAFSGLLIISVLGLVFVRKSQKKINSNRKS